ncbi:MAG: 1-deoxy-D-xylulose-5-phosphate reductoisomerase [Gammaproteobacteria bacterium]
MIGVTILGSTGTIGVNTLDVIGRHQNKFCVIALTANKNVDDLFDQCEKWKPRYAVLADEDSAEQLQTRLKQAFSETEVLAGHSGLEHVASMQETDYVMAGIVGAAGLLPTLAAANAGKRVMLANKEALVMSGQLFMDAVRDNKAQLLPIDSEHNAIFQSMPWDYSDQASRVLSDVGVNKILLTASGGPFREKSISDLESVTPEQAVAHPNWVMGQKISVDSATMMNKGLEIIEACWLFNTDTTNIEVVIHPQSIIHSMVQYNDGSVLAQLGNPDMRTPIAYALSWPDRIDAGVENLDLIDIAKLEFERSDPERFPCLQLACDAINMGGTQTAILNAANEIAVESFLLDDLKFSAIPAVIEETLSGVTGRSADSISVILEADQNAREYAKELVKLKL